MGLILSIETATPVCSVALAQDGQLLALAENKEGNRHASHITLLIDEAMRTAGRKLKELDAIAVSMGPGSYTGLRVGVSTAKGLCYALARPLISIGTLGAMASGFIRSMKGKEAGAHFVPMIDARRMEVYAAVFDERGNEKEQTAAVIIDENSFSRFTGAGPTWFFGTGAPKCREQIRSANANFSGDFDCSAAFMVPKAEEKFRSGLFEDLAYFEPYYLKEFVGTVRKQ